MSAELALFAVPAAKPKRKARRPKPQVDTTAPVTYDHWIAGGARMWSLTFPAPAPMLSVNSGNQHWRKTSPIHKTWREAMFLHAKAAKLPTGLSRVRVEMVLRFPTNGRRDVGNYYTHAVKPTVDAIGPPIDKMRGGRRVIAVGYGLIADDTAQYLDGPHVILGPKVGDPKRCPFGEVVVTITDLSGEVTP